MQEVKIIKADLSQHEFIYLVPLSDLHWDEPQSSHETIRGYVDWIKRHNNAYTILNGDLVTAPTDKSAASLFETAEPGSTIKIPSLDQCADELTELFYPIRNRILAACSGGHELNHLFRVTGTDWTYNLMKRLKREDVYARDGGFLLIKTKPLMPKDNLFFSVIFTHGWGSARTRGAKMAKLERLAHGVETDIVILSHDHTEQLTRDQRFVPQWDTEKSYIHRIMLVATGAFRGWSGYPLRSGYPPPDLGTPRIRIGKRIGKDGTVRKDIHSSI